MTHKVAVNGYIIKENKFLLLKRINPPKIWVPPGGRLYKNEHPEQGLLREVNEETGLRITIIQPVTTWFGTFGKDKLLSIDYLCINPLGQFQLSKEHEQYKWASLTEIKSLLAGKEGFQFEDFKKTMQLFQFLFT